MTDGPVIRLDGLSRRFGDITAVESLRFSVAAGEMFGLVGPDGAGKTTTIRMLCGILEPTGGTAEILGCDKDHLIEDVTFENLRIHGQPIKSAADGRFTLNPFTKNVQFRGE